MVFEFLPPTIVPIATLRSVDPKLKGLSMGLQWDILRIFGTIPGPVLLGLLMDNACNVWQITCDERQSCWIYDANKMFLAVFVLREFLLFAFPHKMLISRNLLFQNKSFF